jgi:hypothetical protein
MVLSDRTLQAVGPAYCQGRQPAALLTGSQGTFSYFNPSEFRRSHCNREARRWDAREADAAAPDPWNP